VHTIGQHDILLVEVNISVVVDFSVICAFWLPDLDVAAPGCTCMHPCMKKHEGTCGGGVRDRAAQSLA
jgi:hypothetical protein